MKILIVGAGGIGGYFGAKLIQAGADITYLLRPKRHAHLQANGLAIESPRGNFLIHPQAITPHFLFVVCIGNFGLWTCAVLWGFIDCKSGCRIIWRRVERDGTDHRG